MEETQRFQDTRRIMFQRSVYVLLSPIFMVFAVIACAGTALVGTPSFTCPTPIPLPTATTLAGTAQPSPMPQPTAYVILPPADFYVGDAVYVGTSQSEQGVRFRLLNVTAHPASPDRDGIPRQVYSWQLEVGNIGTEVYEVFPGAQLYLSTITTSEGELTGRWYPTREAGETINQELDTDVYRLDSGETRVFNLMAFAPLGQATRFTFQLDPTSDEGSGTITWLNQPNPYCTGDVTDP